MFWVNFEWLVFTEPHNYMPDGDTIRLNKSTTDILDHIDNNHIALAVVLDVMLEA